MAGEQSIDVSAIGPMLTTTAGLVAFHIGLYTLIGRERKSPYVINSIFVILILCLISATTVLLSTVVPVVAKNWVYYAGVIVLVGAFLYSIFMVWRIAVRFIYFVDNVRLKDLPGVRHIRRLWMSLQKKPTYQHDPVPLTAAIREKIGKILSSFADGKSESREELGEKSLAVAVEHQGQANKLLCALANAFLSEGFSVQYLSASRHPIEFVEYLEKNLDKNLAWQTVRAKIIVIDAYSPHFAFLDSIYLHKDLKLKASGVEAISAGQTYAGMHSASARAFNKLMEAQASSTRNPTLVIYEDAYALTDLESPEQYRIFVRHVIPSERLWDGMFTVFVETSQPDSDWRVLQTYASMRLDLRSRADTQQPK